MVYTVSNLSYLLKLILLSCFFISAFSGCASSDVSRYTASSVDLGVRNAKDLVEGASSTDIAGSYGNTTQGMKGAIFGGAVGAAVGASSWIGIWPGAAAGMILGASYGQYIDSHTSRQDRLENRGVNIIVLGDQILIVIPSARIFEPVTSTIKPQAYSTLRMVAQYINRYTKILVKVSAFSNFSNTADIDLALTQQQAEAVSKNLLASGVDARIMYARGYGGTRLVTKTSKDWDESDNYRIEITLEKLYV